MRAGAIAALTLLCALTASNPAVADSAVVDRTVQDGKIEEASGLAASLLHPGVVWTHNDSDNPARIYAVAPTGRTSATLRLTGVANVDWEAIIACRDRSGRALLAVADIGDNARQRTTLEVDLIPEPTRLVDAKVTPARVLTLRYPDGAADAETLLVDPRTNRMYVVTKGFTSTIYAVPDDVWPGPEAGNPSDSGTLTRVATVPLLMVTDGVVEADGRILLRTYTSLSVLVPIEQAVEAELEPLASFDLPAQEQGEGLTLASTGVALIASEGKKQPILRVALPESMRGAVTPSEYPAGPSSGAAPGAGTGPEDAGTAENASSTVDDSLRNALVAGALGIVLVVTTLALFGVRRRRRNQTR